MPPSRPRPRGILAAVTAVTLAAGGTLLVGGPASAALEPPSGTSDTSSTAGATPTTTALLEVDASRLRDATVPLDSRVIAARIHVERVRAERQQPAPGRDAPSVADAPAVPDSPVPDPADDVRAYAEHVLRGLPGGEAVEIAWDHPAIGNHLGGVRLDEPTVMMLNSRRFEGQPDRIASTVMHEVAHFYQGATIAAHAEAAGGWWAAYWELDAALSPVFGGQWMERSADCVAIHLGATWTHYTSSCSAPGAEAAVEALVSRTMP